MGLFENLFKPRPDGTLERIVEAPLKASGLVERAADAEGEAAPDPATAFLQPKGYAPGSTSPGAGAQNQGFVPVLPTAKRAPAPERKPAPATSPAAAGNMVILTVGDVLPRIPVAFLRPGPRDLKRELRFHIEDLASDITRGRPAIALSCIAEQCPELFLNPISDAEDMAIRLPLQKLVEQVGRIRSHALPAAPQVFHSPVRPPATVPAEKPKPAPPVPVPVLPPVVEKIVEQVAPPPVTPPPVAVAVFPPPPPVPEPVVTPIAAEPPQARGPEPPVAPPEIIPDEPPAVAPPAPAPSAEMTPTGSVIDLSLAAIVAKVPQEMVAEPLPHIDEASRISLPFPMIERQLGTGFVEIPSKLFWSALPPLLKHYFVVREDLTVPLPLEEIFQNLPVAGGEKPRFEPIAAASIISPRVETPIVLAPVPHDDATPELDLHLSAPPIVERESAPAPPAAPALLAPEPEPEPIIAPEPLVAKTVALPGSVSATEPSNTLPEDVILAASVRVENAEVSAASAAPAEEQSAFVHLQPFRVFTPPTPSVEPEPAVEATFAEPVVLGTAPLAPTPSEAGQVLRPAPEAPTPPVAAVPPEGAEVADEMEPMSPPAPVPLEAEVPEVPAPQFSVLPAPAPESEPPPAALPPEPEPLVAFNPDQPPPLKIEAPAAAVAVLRATVAAPEEVPAVAMAAGSIQPPRMFRPVVLPPPISGLVATAPVNLAPTLAGPGSTAGMISLSPAPEARSPALFTPATVPSASAAPPRAFAPAPPVAPVAEVAAVPVPPAAEPAAQEEPAPTLKDLVRRLFTGPGESAPVTSAPEAVPAPAEQRSAAPPSGAASAPFHLHLPPLPSATPTPPPSVEHAPPALPISRFDQHSLQSLFMTEETLDLSKVSRLAATLPGIQGCVIVARGETFSGGLLPEGFHLNALRGLAPQVGAAADRLPIGELKNFTLYGEQYSISFFERPAVCLCAVHRARSFVPGVREKLVAVVDELARV